jgi:hypothetical protein
LYWLLRGAVSLYAFLGIARLNQAFFKGIINVITWKCWPLARPVGGGGF